MAVYVFLLTVLASYKWHCVAKLQPGDQPRDLFEKERQQAMLLEFADLWAAACSLVAALTAM